MSGRLGAGGRGGRCKALGGGAVALSLTLAIRGVHARPEAAGGSAESSRLAASLAVIVNDASPLSVAIGSYYQARRAIPSANIIHIRLDPERVTLRAEEFALIKAQVDARTSAQVQFYAL